MRVAALVSGGKDSALALYRAIKLGYTVECLVAIIPQRQDSWMFHFPNIHMTDFFAKAADIPLVKGETSGLKEVELEDLKHLLERLDVEAVVSGAIASDYQKTRIEKVCKELGIASVTPLWQEDPLRLLTEIVAENFETIIVGVYAYGFDSSWLGKTFNAETVDELVQLNRKHQISIVGEGGEYETLVLDAPFFKKRIGLLEVEKVWGGQSGCLVVKKAKLVKK